MILKISIFQHHSIPGNIEYNFNKLKDFYFNSLEKYPMVDVIVAGELALSGYTPLDEFYNTQYLKELQLAVSKLTELTKERKTTIIFGDIFLDKDNKLYNVAYVISKGKITNIIKKQKLVDYDVFNETRYFNKGLPGNNIIEINGVKLAILVCEDLWHKDVVLELQNYEFNAVITLNASPYYKCKLNKRLDTAFYLVKTLQKPLIYINIVGGVDGVVFDGRSFVINKNLTIVDVLELAKEQSAIYSLNHADITLIDKINIATYGMDFIPDNQSITSLHDCNNLPFKENSENSLCDNNLMLTEKLSQEFYEIIQAGFIDFIKENNFKGVIIGVSGGIDSALSTTIACDTLGSENVIAVSMPFLYTSDLSKKIINDLKINLGFSLLELPIEDIFNQYMTIELPNNDKFKQKFNKITQENLQSRIRATILMAISNSYPGYIVLCNGNKTELATGYFTLYGDSCGGFNLIKDLFKTEVYSLAKWRNTNLSRFSTIDKLNIIPEECINRIPSAELSFNQKDEDELLPYPLLDSILKDIIENNTSYYNLIKKYSQKDVTMVMKLLKTSEYKRKQGVIGVKLKNRGFGKEWQYPITNGFKLYESNN